MKTKTLRIHNMKSEHFSIRRLSNISRWILKRESKKEIKMDSNFFLLIFMCVCIYVYIEEHDDGRFGLYTFRKVRNNSITASCTAPPNVVFLLFLFFYLFAFFIFDSFYKIISSTYLCCAANGIGDAASKVQGIPERYQNWMGKYYYMLRSLLLVSTIIHWLDTACRAPHALHSHPLVSRKGHEHEHTCANSHTDDEHDDDDLLIICCWFVRIVSTCRGLRQVAALSCVDRISCRFVPFETEIVNGLTRSKKVNRARRRRSVASQLFIFFWVFLAFIKIGIFHTQAIASTFPISFRMESHSFPVRLGPSASQSIRYLFSTFDLYTDKCRTRIIIAHTHAAFVAVLWIRHGLGHTTRDESLDVCRDACASPSYLCERYRYVL